MRDHQRRRPARSRLDPRDESGAVVTTFLLMMVPVFVVLLGMVFDFAQAYTSNARAINIAEQAARAGAQQLDLDVVRGTGSFRLNQGEARTAAHNFLAAAGFPDEGITVSDDAVDVTTHWQVQTAFLGIIGKNTFDGPASASARMAVGVNDEVP